MDDRDKFCTCEEDAEECHRATWDSITGSGRYNPANGRTTNNYPQPYWPNQPRGYEDVNERAIREDAIDHS